MFQILIKKGSVSGGFTLIELILYISLSATILLAISLFFILLLQVRIKSQVIATVNQEGERAMSIITQAIRNAVSINNPDESGEETETLSLNTNVSEKNPTTFYLSNGIIMMKEGDSGAVPITSDLVVVSNLKFRNLSGSSAPANIDITFTINHIK